MNNNTLPQIEQPPPAQFNSTPISVLLFIAVPGFITMLHTGNSLFQSWKQSSERSSQQLLWPPSIKCQKTNSCEWPQQLLEHLRHQMERGLETQCWKLLLPQYFEQYMGTITESPPSVYLTGFNFWSFSEKHVAALITQTYLQGLGIPF